MTKTGNSKQRDIRLKSFVLKIQALRDLVKTQKLLHMLSLALTYTYAHDDPSILKRKSKTLNEANSRTSTQSFVVRSYGNYNFDWR